MYLSYEITLWNFENKDVRKISKFQDRCIQMSLWLEKSLILSVIYYYSQYMASVILVVQCKGNLSGALF